MLKVQLVDVVFSQEVTFNVAITPAGEVEGTVEVPISELERLSQWKEVNWRNLLFVYEKEMTWSSRCQGVIQMVSHPPTYLPTFPPAPPPPPPAPPPPPPPPNPSDLCLSSVSLSLLMA
eukprot:scaffold1946_cov188-Ochromonas_danica.AAC.9